MDMLHNFKTSLQNVKRSSHDSVHLVLKNFSGRSLKYTVCPSIYKQRCLYPSFPFAPFSHKYC